MGTLDNFHQSIETVLRPNRFKMRVNFPAFIGDIFGLAKDCEMFVRSTSIIGNSIGEIDIPYLGVPYTIGGDPNKLSELSVSILNVGNMNLRKAFRRWQEFITSRLLGTRANDLTYFGTVTIEQLDGANNVIFTQEHGLSWPTSVGDMRVDYEANNQVQLFDVTFRTNIIVEDLL